MHPRTITSLTKIVPGTDGRWVRRGVTVAILAYAIVTVSGLVLRPESVRDLVFEAAVPAVGLVSLSLIARGHVVLAARLFLVAIWLEIVSGIFFAGTLMGSAALVLGPIVLGVGLFQGGRGALVTALLTGVVAPSAAWLGHRVLETTGPPPFTAHYLLVLVAVLWATALLVHMGLDTLEKLLIAAIASERKFTDLVNNASDGMLSVDGEGRIVSANPAAAEMLGCEVDSMVGRPLEALAPELCERLPACPHREAPDGTDAVQDPDETGDVTADMIVIRRGGGTVAAEASARAVTLSDGRAGIQITLRDVSERRTAMELATQLGGIVENALNEVYIFHAVTWRLLKVNRGGRENLGYEADELEQLTVSQVNPTLGPVEGREILERLGSSENTVLSVRGVHRRKNGSLYPVEAQLQGGRLFGEPVVVAFAADVSQREASEQEQRRLQAQLEHAQKMEAVGHLAGGVAHDFNNLLTVVGGYAALLQASDDDETRELATEIARAHERGATLTRQLLAFARKEVAQPRMLSLTSVVRDMERILLRVLGECFELNIETSGAGCIIADLGQLEQILLNLVANARDAMSDGGTITLRVSDEGRHRIGDRRAVTLEVSDTGVGMDSATVRQIFQPFYTTKPRGKGTGLGLSTVHGIVVQNEGTVEANSTPGEGTVIRILWPRSDTHPDVAGEEDANEAVQPGSGTILVAEDDDALRALVIRLLESAGFTVLPARHGAHALEISDGFEGDIDLLLTDMVMPGLNGIDLAERMRANRPGVGVLFMSGYLDDELHGDNRLDQTRDLLLKPFRGPELLERVHGTMTGAALRR